MPHRTETQAIVNEQVNTPSRSGSSGLTLSRAGTDQYVSDAKLNLVHTKITLGADLVLVASVDNAAKVGGAQLFTFPVGYVTIHNARIEGFLGSSVSDMTSTAGEIGLGTATSTAAAAVLSSTLEDILQGARPAMANMLAATDLAVKAGGTIRTGSIGSFAGAAACFLNVASTWGNVAVAGDIIARAGMTIDILWSIAED